MEKQLGRRVSLTIAAKRTNVLLLQLTPCELPRISQLSIQAVLAKSDYVLEEIKQHEDNDTLKVILRFTARALGLIGVVIFGKAIFSFFRQSLRPGGNPFILFLILLVVLNVLGKVSFHGSPSWLGWDYPRLRIFKIDTLTPLNRSFLRYFSRCVTCPCSINTIPLPLFEDDNRGTRH